MNFTQNHLHFRSEDPDAAAKFYCDNFGAVIASERPLSTTKSITLGTQRPDSYDYLGEGRRRRSGARFHRTPLRPGPLRL